ncbi:MAG TPA: D-alanyl-D-alanine carboxypeptidase/D-alanyl-D-alanine-endopeptidase, partial [Alcanivorax sp.]|nr:D-alanyl-D-alanine carboxypeptidase/D-alanyl-D-alanine-endopeptidase [Alcanivorax sp.]
MRLAVRVLSIVVAATLLTAPAGAEDWPDRIMERMEALQLPDEALALAAVPLDGPGEARFVNADRVMNPGSTMKLLTTYAALELLGPSFKWHTRVYTNGELNGDVLEGDLFLVGAGDPKLTEER